MSDLSIDVNLKEQLMRIDRMFEETAKFRSEAAKLRAEEKKLDRERLVSALTASAALLGAGAVIATLALKLAGMLA